LVKYYEPVELSDGNITILQSNGGGHDIVRQIVFLNSIQHENYIRISDEDPTTVNITILDSTFNVPDETYYVLIDNNFVKSQIYKEPLYGLNEEVWTFKTRRDLINFSRFK